MLKNVDDPKDLRQLLLSLLSMSGFETLAQVYRAIEKLCQGYRAKPRPLAQRAQPIT
jgi:hypothetical protein